MNIVRDPFGVDPPCVGIIVDRLARSRRYRAVPVSRAQMIAVSGARLMRVTYAVLAGLGISQILALARDGLYLPGHDYAMYMERARSWLAGDGFYLSHQLAGPYPIAFGDAMYPPVTLVLFAPFTVLPAILWWAIPLAIIGACLWRLRPSPWLLLLVLLWPRTTTYLVSGNPSLWAIAALTAGLVWHWPAAFSPLKLTLGPFALVGVRHRSWWLATFVFALCCVPFGTMWLDFLTALTNARPTPALSVEYVLGDIPIALGLIVASADQQAPQRARAALHGVRRWVPHLRHDLGRSAFPRVRRAQRLAHGLRDADLSG